MFYPAHLNLQNRKCLVFGGGIVAERKVISLLRCGGQVTLISPETTTVLYQLSQADWIQWRQRQFQPGDSAGMFLVCAATDSPEINTRVFHDAHEEHGINLVNVVDVIPECTFAAASVVTHGDLTISISTSGKSPAISRRIREYLETKFAAESLYTTPIEAKFTPSRGKYSHPYPVYFLVENRRCKIIRNNNSMSEEIGRRVHLLKQCGASIEQIDAAHEDLNRISDAFLVYFDNIESNCGDSAFAARTGNGATRVPNRIQLFECLNNAKLGTFVTPILVVDGNMIIGITAKTPTEKAQETAKHLQTELANQFESNGYGPFIDFLGALRPLVMDAVPTQRYRQEFFENLIDQVPLHQRGAGEGKKCCLRFENPGCSAECAFNLVCQGQGDRVRQHVLHQIGDRKIN
ncbi:MAG: bifunctional precorrin-2 dehydrogenase/sirohydrochlorin ferrochelatase [Candidatus Poribacteria bacterium]|nr:bifunctional precorrin-2 dehydrogenase/sirohydrochlorin ferrochelatase [Candidatus Poribacteria bacterium]